MRSLRFLALLLGLLLGHVSPLWAANPLTPQVPEPVKQAMQDRNYAAAIKAIDEAAKQKDAPLDYLGYLKARALHLSEKFDEALLAFDQVEKQHANTKSPWARQARFGKAMSLVRSGDFRAAEVIYRQEVAYLLSAARKQEIAQIYLEFAQGYFKPADENAKPDYAKALEFFNKALEVGPLPAKRIEVELLIARCYQELAQHPEAAQRFAKFVKDHPGHESEIEARYRQGQCQRAMGQAQEARRTWQDLLAAYPDSKHERIAETAFHLAGTYGIPAPASSEDLGLGVAALEAFIARFPEHKLASLAHLQIAQSYVARGRHEDAITALTKFLADERYATRDEVPEARNLLGRSYQLQRKFPEALVAWREYLAKHPAHEGWSSVQQQILNTEYLMGLEKRQAKQYEQAVKLWNEFLAKYPLDGRSRAILYQFGAMHFEQEKWDEAIADWRRLVSKYPNTNESSQAQFMIAATLEEKLARFDEALKEYRKLTWGNFTSEAQRRINRLTAKSLAIVTERVFRTDETPKIKLTSRNIDSVQVRAYTVDLETYFRKMHLARGLEGLDISLIDPDKSFEFKVPKYVEHQQLESEIELPLPKMGDAAAPKAGVLAVTVSSKTLEATTMLLQSDLDIVVKSSREEVFVFAQNMRTGKPWPKARLLVSNGSQVFAEGATGDDGVYVGQASSLSKERQPLLRDAADIRVFAVAEGSVASNVVDLQGVGVAQGLTDKGYLYTDRPAYRAGQVVHVRGIVRRVAGDAYVIDSGKKFTLNVYDARSRLVREDKIELNAFGSFHSHFLLPQTSPAGDYRLQIVDDNGVSYEGTFAVHEYQLEPVQLTVDTPRKVYYRGEEVSGKIVAKFYYGAPVVGREVRYQWADGRTYTGTTDDKGELAFKLPTRDFREAQTLSLTATLAERNLQTSVNFYLATQGFTIGVTTIRPVYVSGETFEAALTTTDAEGKPLAEKLSLHVLQQTTVEGKVGEKLIEKHDVATESTGKGRLTLKLEAGATYVLRAEGTDRFKNPITGQHTVQVSDDQDRVRLRILADKHTYKVGDQATVRVHWREAPAPALVTFQGARVLKYQLVDLKTGANDLPIPMTAALAPNFELSVVVMTDARKAPPKQVLVRFHEANSPFTVERDLRVKVDVRRKGDAKGPYRPGEEIDVVVTTTDPQGKPAAAEVSLAMVEQSLLELFQFSTPAIHDFFTGGRRETAVRTTSSITFDYKPGTRPINTRLLAEAERLEIAGEESARLRDLGELIITETGAFHDRRVADGPAKPGQADFESLTDVITSTVAPNTWDETNGSGRIAQFQTNLSLIIDQSQTVHENAPALSERSIRTQDYLVWGAPSRSGEDSKANGKFGWGFGTRGFLPPNAANLGKLRAENRHDAIVLFSDGAQLNVNFSNDFDGDAGLASVAAKLAAAGAVLLPDLGPQETGYWNPAIVTDAEGKATVSFTLPERSTAWRFLSKGITTETLAGEATGDLTVKKDLFGELKLPLAFTDGDEVEVIASVHNDSVEKGAIEVTLKTTIGGKSVEEKKTLNVTAKGVQELVFKTALRRPIDGGDVAAAFELTVTAANAKDVVRRSVPVQPYGMNVHVISSGAASSDTTAWVEPPKEMPFSGASLSILIGPSIERSLLDVLLGTAPACQIESARIASGLDVAASDLMAAVGLQKLTAATREAGGPQAQALDARIRASLSLIVSSQHDDGGWSWTGRGGATNRFTTARIVWALSLARAAGYSVAPQTLDKADAFLASQVAATAETDYESKAILLHALATRGKGDFALANRLHRNRPSMSSGALAHLALALVEMERLPLAQDIVDLLSQRKLEDPTTRRKTALGTLPWTQSEAELRALYALAVQRVSPAAPKVKESVDWLLEHRSGHRWAPEKATGPATLALCDWFSRTKFTGENYKLAVFVNDTRVQLLELGENAGTQTIEVPAKFLDAKGKQRINFQLTGRGRFTYQCIYSGFVAADKLKSTTPDWRVARFYEPAPLELDGHEIPRGFGILQGSYTTFRNKLTQLPMGQRGHVQLEIYRNNVPSQTPEEQLEYLVVTEPIASGATVIEKSVRGNFDRFEITPGAITFYIGSRYSIGTIHYEVHGYLPGDYKAGPTVVRNAYLADQIAVATPASLEVLARNAKSGDDYKLTPQELFELGKRWFAKGDTRLAGNYLTQLFANWNLQPEPYKETARMLLDVHLEHGPPAQVVRYFEIIKEKWPELEIPFEKIVRVGAAYDEIGEYERSYLVFRATVESSFLRESAVAGFLEGQGEFVRSVDVMGRLLAEYPPEPYVAAASYALTQRVYAKAPEAANDPKLREKKINRVDLIRQALAMLDSFLTSYPDDPAADQAAFSLANALLDLKAYQNAISQCNKYAARYPQSDFLDSYWYVIGYCHFALGEHEQALAMCRKVAEHKRTEKRTGREVESPNKWQAIYILGQVYHSLGKAADAIREYVRVAEQFVDARQAIDYFTRKEIAVPEVTMVKPGEAAEVELKFRNVPRCDTKVYRIDLMKFSLLKRNLGGITQINLAGIRPHHEAQVELGDGKDYRDRTRKLSLPLKEEGAYLVVVRGDDLHASGLVLVSPLKVEIQEEVSSGRVRATVKDLVKDRYVSEVHVKVIGTRNDDFVSGSTDLRGVFVADQIKGTSTVIAQLADDRYAFYRGQTELGPPQAPAPGAPAPQMEQSTNGQVPGGEGDLLKNLKESNSLLQRLQGDQLENFYKQDNKGVKAKAAF